MDNNGLFSLEGDSVPTIFCKLGNEEQSVAHIGNMKTIGNFNRNSISSRCVHHVLKSTSCNGIDGRGITEMDWNMLLE